MKSAVDAANFRNDVFLTYPLIGFELFTFPFTINCIGFKSTVEREAIDLYHIFEEKDINGQILKSSIAVFKSLIDYLCEQQYTNIFVIMKKLNGNKYIENIIENQRKICETFSTAIQDQMIQYILTKPIIPTSKGFKKIYLPPSDGPFDLSTNNAILWEDYRILKSQTESSDSNILYSTLVSILVRTCLPCDMNEEWISAIRFVHLANRSILTFRKLIEALENTQCIDSVQIYDPKYTVFQAIDILILFANHILEDDIPKCQIIPTLDGVFHIPKDVKGCEIDQEFLTSLEDNFDINYRSIIVHPMIHNFEPSSKLEYKDLENEIVEKLNDKFYTHEQKLNVSLQIISIQKSSRETSNDIQKTMSQIYCTFNPSVQHIFSTSKYGYFPGDTIYLLAYDNIVLDLNAKLIQYSTLTTVCQHYQMNEENLCEILNNYYDCCKKYQSKFSNFLQTQTNLNFVIPNESGDFIDKDISLVCIDNEKRSQIDDLLYDLSDLFYGDKGWRNIIIHHSILEKYARRAVPLKSMYLKWILKL